MNEKKIIIYTIYRDDNCGWSSLDPKDFKEEIEEYSALDSPFKLDAEKVIQIIEYLDIDEVAVFWDLKFICHEVFEDEFYNAEEFTGW